MWVGNNDAWKGLTLVLLLAALPVLAGCIGTAQATAMEEQDTADARAEAWDQDAQLVGVVGVEGAGWMMSGDWDFSGMGNWDWDWDWDWNGDWDRASRTDQQADRDGYTVQSSHGSSSGDYWERAKDDERIGDGKCELWAYRYISANQPGQAFVVVVDRDGEVVHEGVEARQSDDVPIGTWRVDSDEAAEIARDANDGIRVGTDAEHYGLVLVLGHDDEHRNPVWFIAGGGGDESGGGGGFVVLDAVTGEVYASQGGFGMTGR